LEDKVAILPRLVLIVIYVKA